MCSQVDVRRRHEFKLQLSTECIVLLVSCLSKLMLTFQSVLTILWVNSCLLCLADLMDTITGPSEEFIPVLGSPMAPPAMTVEAPTISSALPSEGRTSPSISRPNTAASYGLEQLESEGILVSSHTFEKQLSWCVRKPLGKLAQESILHH